MASYDEKPTSPVYHIEHFFFVFLRSFSFSLSLCMDLRYIFISDVNEERFIRRTVRRATSDTIAKDDRYREENPDLSRD